MTTLLLLLNIAIFIIVSYIFINFYKIYHIINIFDKMVKSLEKTENALTKSKDIIWQYLEKQDILIDNTKEIVDMLLKIMEIKKKK